MYIIVTLSSPPTVWLELLGKSAALAELLAGCPPELPGASQDTWTCVMHMTMHILRRDRFVSATSYVHLSNITLVLRVSADVERLRTDSSITQ